MLGRLGDRVRFMRDHRWTPRHASEYIDDELGPEGRRRVDHHRGECRECDSLLESLHSMVVALGGMRGSTESGVAAAVLAGVREELGGGHGRPH